VVTCGPRQFDPLSPITLTNPTLLVEVLSPGTADYDRGPKLVMYQRMPSVRAVVLASTDRWCVEAFAREPDGRWVHSAYDDPAGEVAIPGLPVPVRFPLAEVYRDADVPRNPPLRPHSADEARPDSPVQLIRQTNG
jgi:Uma2 family endonuclease